MIMTATLVSHGLLYVLTGIFAGLMSGILGLGGGILVVPALLLIFSNNSLIPKEFAMHMASATSLAIMIFTAQASIRAHNNHGDILWGIYRRLLPGLLLGSLSGALLVGFISGELLKLLLALVMSLVVFHMLFGKKSTVTKQTIRRWLDGMVSYLLGLNSGLLGIGGGVLIIPYLDYCGIELRKITAISALCTLTVSLIGTIVVIATSLSVANLPMFATGFVYWPAVIAVAIPSSLLAPYGAKLTYMIPVDWLRYGFIAIFLLTAILLLIE